MFLGRILRASAVAAGALLCLQLDAAADPIVYDGTLVNGVTAPGEIGAGDVGNALQADYWRFWATAGDNVTVITRRVDGAFDPAQHVFSGIYGDTTDLGLTNGGNDLDNGLNLIDFADDELPPAVSGPFGDPQTIFVASTTGWYTVAVTEFLSGPLPTDGDYDYGITVRGITGSPVPEPTFLALLACGACGVAVSRRRRKSA